MEVRKKTRSENFIGRKLEILTTQQTQQAVEAHFWLFPREIHTTEKATLRV